MPTEQVTSRAAAQSRTLTLPSVGLRVGSTPYWRAMPGRRLVFRKPLPFNILSEDSGAPPASRDVAGVAQPTEICWSAYWWLAGHGTKDSRKDTNAMKSTLSALLLTVVSGSVGDTPAAPVAFAQTGVSGTWRAESIPPGTTLDGRFQSRRAESQRYGDLLFFDAEHDRGVRRSHRSRGHHVQVHESEWRSHTDAHRKNHR